MYRCAVFASALDRLQPWVSRVPLAQAELGAQHSWDLPLEGSFALQTTYPALAAGKTFPSLN